MAAMKNEWSDATLDSMLRARAAEAPDRVLLTFLENGEDVSGELTYAELLARSGAVAAKLAEISDPGDRVLLLYPPSLDYVTAFFGCLLSRRVAVPVYPPNPHRLEQTLSRLMHIVQDSQPRVVATTSMIQQMAQGVIGDAGMGPGALTWCATDVDNEGLTYDAQESESSDSLAFLQYTSGSTARPRGVRVTHRNLFHNVKLIAHTLGATPDTVGISWLPMYHDMGLIGKIITPAVVGCRVVLMSPLDFLRKPMRWLNAVSEYGGTVSAAPNFAYDLCVRKVLPADLEGLDLSTWRVALNAAEPVRADTIDRFVETFAPAGFAREAFMPAYGLAESTLLVTGAKEGPRIVEVASNSLEGDEIQVEDAPSVGTRTLVTAGKSAPELDVRIVDPETRRELQDCRVGEIWVSGDSVADGYWAREEESASLFRATLEGEDGPEFLRTGDLGFLLGEELVVTGRRKDLMIFRGRNIYPQDIELTVSEAHQAVRPGGMAAFSIDGDDGEELVVVAELERRTTSGRAADDRRYKETLPDHEVDRPPAKYEVSRAVRDAVSRRHQIDLTHIVLIKPGTVPKTSSGKIQRHECRRLFLANELDEFERLSKDDKASGTIPKEPPVIHPADLIDLPHEHRVERLVSYLAELVAFTVQRGTEEVVGVPLTSLGLDSLAAMEIQGHMESALSIRPFPSLLLGGAGVREVAEELATADLPAASQASSVGLDDISSEIFSGLSEGAQSEVIVGRDRSEAETSSALDVVREVISSRRARTVFQAVKALDDQRVLGYEALSRAWVGEAEHGGDELFQAAHRAELAEELDRVCRSLAIARRPELADGRVLFLNCLPRAFFDPRELLGSLGELLSGQSIDASQIVLEVTDRVHASDLDRMRDAVTTLRDQGYRFCIDSAGAGANTAALAELLSPAFLKVDRRIIENLAGSGGSGEKLRELQALAEGLGADLIAFGISDRATFDAVREAGIAFGQGYYLGFPEPNSGALSWSERGLWYYQNANPQSWAANIYYAGKLPAGTSRDKAAEAARAVVSRHRTLRTSYPNRNGEPIREYRSNYEPAIERVDARDWSVDRLERDFEKRSRVPFDLQKGPVIRFTFYERERRPILHVATHHIAADFWSLDQIVRELGEAVTTGPDYSPVDVSYDEYVSWQRQMLASNRGQWLENVWREQLSDSVPRLQLPGRLSRTMQTQNAGASFRKSLPQELMRSLDEIAVEKQTTRYALLLSVYQLLLHYWTGQGDFMVGVVAAGRTRSSFANVVGNFANPLPLRSHVERSLSFEDLVEQTRATLLQIIDAQEYPLETMLERFDVKREGSENPIVQTLFASEQSRDRAGVLGGQGGIETMDVGAGGITFDFGVMVHDFPDGSGGLRFQYNDTRFSEGMMARLADRYLYFVERIARNPSITIGDLLWDERDPEVVEMGTGAEVTEAPQVVHAMFEERAAEQPDAVAIVGSKRSWSYGEVNEQANRWARELQARGVGLESVVAVAMRRSPEQLIALLAILKAGGAYVPVAPEFPAARMQYMFEDSGARLVLTDGQVLDVGGVEVERLTVAELDSSSREHGHENLPVRQTADNLLTVLFTSGSTGRPKGIMIRHAALWNLIQWPDNPYALEAGDVVLQKTPFTFDMSPWEFFAPLAVGARVVVLGDDLQRQASDIRAAIENHGVTHLQVVPTQLQELLDHQDLSRAKTLRHIIAGGEVLTPTLRDALKVTLPTATLHNAYGPGEMFYTTVWTCTGESESVIPVGGPLPGLNLFLLNRSGILVGVEQPGELFGAGVSLARGYAGDARRTAERFVPAPFAPSAPGSRMYRSGDLLRWREDGSLTFVGRVDRQVKVQGNRVELEEVEIVLERHPDVARAAVVPVRAADGQRVERLAGFVTSKGPKLDGGDLRTFASDVLPYYAVPGFIEVIDEMPLTSSGKIDRLALAEQVGTDTGSTFVAPRNETERTIAAIWEEHLEVPSVGVHDDFYELGGHSLVAVRIRHRLSEALGVEITLDVLNRVTTVADLAAYVEEEERNLFAAVEKHDYGTQAPLSAEQRQMWILQNLESNRTTYHSPGVFQLDGPLHAGALQQALTRLAERHELLRTIYPIVDDEPVQKILPAPEVFPWNYHDVRDEADPVEKAREIVSSRVAEPFDLTEDVSLRVSLVRTGDETHVFCMSFHHIAIDEWTIALIFQELRALYENELLHASPEGMSPEELRVSDWNQAFDVAYRGLDVREQSDPTFQPQGWTSSYSGKSYSDEEMRDWLDGSLHHLEGEQLGRVLEVGCGTGMLLFRLAGQADEYVGLDFSPSALEYVEGVIDSLDRDLSHVRLVEGRADALGEIEGTFDTIIINSVVQYFPDQDYFESVLRAAADKLRPGGFVYVGDIRDSRSQFAFHASVQAQRASGETKRDELKSRALARSFEDDEVTLSPGDLAQLARAIPSIGYLDLAVPPAKHATEMSRFRYGAFFRAAEGMGDVKFADRRIDWMRDGLDATGVREALESSEGSLLVTSVPNARVEEASRLQAWLFGEGAHATVEEFLSSPKQLTSAIEPDELRAIGERNGYRVTVMPANDALGACVDVVYEPRGADLAAERPLTPVTSQVHQPGSAAPSAGLPREFGDPWTITTSLLNAKTKHRQEASKKEEAASRSPLPVPELQYADYAIWQNEQLRSKAYERGVSYWKGHLQGAPQGVDWPFGEEPSGREHPARYVQWDWSVETTEAVRAYARAHGTSEFVVVFTAFSAFLASYTGQPDITVGVGTTMRQRPEFKDIVGYLLNMLPLRTRIGEGGTYHQWFEETKKNWAESGPHQWIPLERIVEEMGVQRGVGRLPLYDVMFTYVPKALFRRSGAMVQEIEALPGVGLRPFEYGGVSHALCSLFVSVFKEGDRIGSEFEYDAARFEHWQIEQMAQRFENAVRRMLAEPLKSFVDEMSYAASVSQSSVDAWTQGPELDVPDTTLHEMFEERAAERPDATALRFDGGEWTFGELEARANRLARALQDRGVRRGTPVGVTVERSPELVMALLGVMKAGGAYVAMEPDLPQSRLAHLSADAGARIVVVDESGRAALGESATFDFVDVTVGSDESISTDRVDGEAESDDIAYVLYTSGTTGVPKGVLVPHSAVVNHVVWLADSYDVTDADVFLLKSSYGFDMSVSELFGPLCLGGVMAIARPGGQRDPKYLVEAVRDFGVTCLRVVPTALNLMLGESGVGEVDGTLRWIMLGGEALPPSVRDRFFELFEKTELHNPFGITETCVDVTRWKCLPSRQSEAVSLGTPMGNYQVYVLDEWGDSLPPRVSGEIHVGGRGVSYGYWGMPSRTATSFVPDRFSTRRGSRLYRSGDLGLWDDAGELHYRGRKDDQVQLFGIRIELGEVEAHLAAAPGVKQAAVKASDLGESRADELIAYVVPTGEGELDVSAVRAYLETVLRRAVVPTRYIVMDDLPRRPSGKVDRSSLPNPYEGSPAVQGETSTREAVPAEADVKERLKAIWCRVLRVEDVAFDANFFEVGGTSLRAIQVHRQLQEEFEVEIDVVELFGHTTIEQLAGFLERGEADMADDDASERSEERGRSRREALGRQRRRRSRDGN